MVYNFDSDRELLSLMRGACATWEDIGAVMGVDAGTAEARCRGFEPISAEHRGVVVAFLRNQAGGGRD